LVWNTCGWLIIVWWIELMRRSANQVARLYQH